MKRMGVAVCSAVFALVVAMLLVPMPARADASAQPEEGSLIVFRSVRWDDYRSFVKNWDVKARPVLCALIRTPAQWDAVFHPAPVMGRKQVFGPTGKDYEGWQLLVMARVISAPTAGHADQVMRVEKVSGTEDELVVRYHYVMPKAPSTYTVKNCAGAWIPRHTYRKIRFFENGKPVCVLELSNGQWSDPCFPPQP